MFQAAGLLIGHLSDGVHTSALVKGGVVQFTYTLTRNGTSSSGKPIEVPEDLHREFNNWPDFIELTKENQREHVFATAATGEYLSTALTAIASIQKYFPGYTIYFYDLGDVNATAIEQVRKKSLQHIFI